MSPLAAAEVDIYTEPQRHKKNDKKTKQNKETVWVFVYEIHIHMMLIQIY